MLALASAKHNAQLQGEMVGAGGASESSSGAWVSMTDGEEAARI